MSNKRLRKKQATLQRAAPMMPPGGALMYVPPGYAQSVYGSTFYGSKAGIPVGQTSLFSPGMPLPTQPGVDPLGRPVQFRFPIASNTFPVDRTMGDPDIPSFQQLRTLAKAYSGITLAERVWLDMVPRMTLKIGLKPEVIAAGGEEKTYQKDLTYFRNFFSYPDTKRDIHTWLRMALKEQTQIDELYIYKHKTRGGRLLALRLIDGAQMKPLLDDWGDIPGIDNTGQPFAYQQYPWGIPGMKYTTEMMIHYQESPAAFSPYGHSRVEGIILLVNIALRKQKKDLYRYTEGNIPAGLMEVPDSLGWTPDMIDAYEQAWNSLLAGNQAQQTRIKFTQPGMKYQQFEQPEANMHLTEFDDFLNTITWGMYGISKADVAFTQEIHKSSDQGQENMLYRRTIDPLASMYAMILTQCMSHDFEPSLHGDLFEARFGGYDEEEDLASNVSAYSQAVQNGLIGLSDANKALNFPEPKDAEYIGRVLITKSGPMFLDDKEVMDAQRQAQLAGFQMAQQAPQDDGEEEDNEPGSQQSKDQPAKPAGKRPPAGKPKPSGQTGKDEQTEKRYTISDLLALLEKEHQTAREEAEVERAPAPYSAKELATEMNLWRWHAIEDMKRGQAFRGFSSVIIPERLHSRIEDELEQCQSVIEVKEVFRRAKEQEQAMVPT